MAFVVNELSIRTEVDGAGSGLRKFMAGLDSVSHGIDADDEQRDLCLVATGGAARPDRDAVTAMALDSPDAAGKAGVAELVDFLVWWPPVSTATARRGRSIPEGCGNRGCR